MQAFLSPTEMFLDWQAEQHENQQDYLGAMDEFAEQAEKVIGQHAEIICEAYLDGCCKAVKLFKEKGLKTIHAYALTGSSTDFIFEYDENERNYPEED